MAERASAEPSVIATIPVIFYAAVSWIGFECGFQCITTVRATYQSGEEVDPLRLLRLFNNFMPQDDAGQ